MRHILILALCCSVKTTICTCAAGYGKSRTHDLLVLGKGETCQKCSPGKYSIANAEYCIFCNRGYFSSHNGSSACKKCPPGSSTDPENNIGSTACQACKPGFYQDGSYVPSACLSCFVYAKNSYTTQFGSVNCTLCPKNMYSNLSHTGCQATPPVRLALPDYSDDKKQTIAEVDGHKLTTSTESFNLYGGIGLFLLCAVIMSCCGYACHLAIKNKEKETSPIDQSKKVVDEKNNIKYKLII